MSIAQLRGTVYPDKSFTVGRVPSPKKRVDDKRYDRAYSQQTEWDANSKIDWLTEAVTVGGEFRSITESPLLVECPKSSQKTRGNYGEYGITNFGKRFLKNACIVLQQRYGKRRLGFATATLPDMDRDTCDAINGNLAEITRRFYQKLKRICEKRGSQFIYVGCVEIQEKRFRNYNIPAPHLHFVYVAKNSVRSRYIFTTKDAYTAWNESVNQVLVKLGREPIMGYGGHKGSVKLESIRSSASAYIGKYVSKGSKVVEEMKEKGFSKFPKQWWTGCMYAKKLFKESIVALDAEDCKLLFYGLERCLHIGIVTWGRFVEIEYEGEYYKVGSHGTLSHWCYNEMVT